MSVKVDRLERTETIKIGSFRIKRLKESGYLSATDFYNKASKRLLKYQRKPTPYYYTKLKHIDPDIIKEMIDCVAIEKMYFNSNTGGNRYFKYFFPSGYWYYFGKSTLLYEKRYYFHPILFFYYYKMFFGFDKFVIIKYMYYEYMIKHVNVGRWRKLWLRALYENFIGNFAVNNNPIFYFHKQMMILLGPLAKEHLDGWARHMETGVKCHYRDSLHVHSVHINEIINVMQLTDYSLLISVGGRNKLAFRAQAYAEMVRIMCLSSYKNYLNKPNYGLLVQKTFKENIPFKSEFRKDNKYFLPNDEELTNLEIL